MGIFFGLVGVLFVLFLISVNNHGRVEEARAKVFRDRQAAEAAEEEQADAEHAVWFSALPESWFIEAGWPGGRAEHDEEEARYARERATRPNTFYG